VTPAAVTTWPEVLVDLTRHVLLTRVVTRGRALSMPRTMRSVVEHPLGGVVFDIESAGTNGDASGSAEARVTRRRAIRARQGW
jgi:uncharacterized membrane protein YdbT with pleckstrin-like domain